MAIIKRVKLSPKDSKKFKSSRKIVNEAVKGVAKDVANETVGQGLKWGLTTPTASAYRKFKGMVDPDAPGQKEAFANPPADVEAPKGVPGQIAGGLTGLVGQGVGAYAGLAHGALARGARWLAGKGKGGAGKQSADELIQAQLEAEKLRKAKSGVKTEPVAPSTAKVAPTTKLSDVAKPGIEEKPKYSPNECIVRSGPSPKYGL